MSDTTKVLGWTAAYFASVGGGLAVAPYLRNAPSVIQASYVALLGASIIYTVYQAGMNITSPGSSEEKPASDLEQTVEELLPEEKALEPAEKVALSPKSL